MIKERERERARRKLWVVKVAGKKPATPPPLPLPMPFAALKDHQLFTSAVAASTVVAVVSSNSGKVGKHTPQLEGPWKPVG